MIDNLEKYNIILASGSPRRQQFLKDLGISFRIELKPIDEQFSPALKLNEIAEYLAKAKADVFTELRPLDILITADTIVWHKGKALNKPENRKEAYEMIYSLQDDCHEVISAFCIKTHNKQLVKSKRTKVYFESLTDDEIYHYIDTFSPFDKAGAYGIQEWIGQVGISKIEGCFYNVMGLPTHLFYKTLKKLIL
jgi:septum formation protein